MENGGVFSARYPQLRVRAKEQLATLCHPVLQLHAAQVEHA